IWAPSWGWVIAANVLLGLNQGMTWSTTVIMKIDLVGPARRGFALGLNEASGYGAVSLTALATGAIAAHHGLRPAPFYLGIAAGGLSVEAIGVLAALYPGVWCVGQLFTGAWSDRVGRKPLITAGMILQGLALALMAVTTGFGPWAVGAVLIGAGTALVYPTLI